MKAKRIRAPKPTEAQMSALAEATGLTHDGGNCGDDRLFDETIFTKSKDYSPEEYWEMEEAINGYRKRLRGCVLYAWNDCSGYGYWCVQMCEDNYIQITVAVTDAKRVDTEQVKTAVESARRFFAKFERR